MNHIAKSQEILFVIIISIIIIINFIEILILIRNRKRLTNYECLLLSMAISDFLVGLSAGSIDILIGIGIIQGLRHQQLSMAWFSIACSLTHTVAITMDRLFAVAYPIKHRMLSTRKKIIVLLVIAWSFSLLVFPISFIWKHHIELFLAVLIIPISFAILISYGFIIKKAVIKRRRFLSTPTNCRELIVKMKKEFNLACMCLSISITFVSMMLPFSIFTIKYGTSPMITKHLLVSNSMSNPLIYFFWKYIDKKFTARKSKNIEPTQKQQRGTKANQINISKKKANEENDNDSDHTKSSQIKENQFEVNNAKPDSIQVDTSKTESKNANYICD